MLAGPPRFVEGLLLAAAVAGVAFSAPLATVAGSVAVPALAIAFWRTALASVVLAPTLGARRGRCPATPRDLAACGGAGLLLAAHFGTWIPSLALTSVASSTALVCTAPLWTAVLARLRGQRVPTAVWLGVVAALAGVVLVSSVDLDVSPRALQGDVLALLGGAFMAGYLVLGQSARRSLSTSTYTLLCYTTAAVVLLGVCVAGGVPLAGWTATGWLLLAAITVCGQFLGHSLFNRALRVFGSSTVAVVTLLEVPGAALIAALWLGQDLAVTTVVGVVVLIAGVALVARAEPQAA